MVTCGGLSPGLNNVIRSMYFELHYKYQVKEVIGFQYGYRGSTRRGPGADHDHAGVRPHHS